MGASKPSAQGSSTIGVNPLLVAAAVAAVFPVFLLLGGREGALLVLFLLGFFYPLAIIFVVVALTLARHALHQQSEILSIAALATFGYIGIWAYVLYNDTAFTLLWIASLVYSGSAIWFALALHREAAQIGPAPINKA